MFDLFSAEKVIERDPHRKRANWERFFEILPAFLTWSTFVLAIFLSVYHPAWGAVYIISLATYWIVKAINSSAHMLTSYKHYRYDVTVDWMEVLNRLSDRKSYLAWLDDRMNTEPRKFRGIIKKDRKKFLAKSGPVQNHKEILHVVLFPFVDESVEILETSIRGVLDSSFPSEQVAIILAAEERAGEQAQQTARILKERYGSKFFDFLVSTHPDGLPGEIRGKSANASYAVEKVVMPWVAERGLNLDNIILSNLDSDTIIHKEYLSRITYEWLLAENPHRSSYQPVTLYNNNVWESPGWVRVVAVSNTFWILIEASRPDRLATFSSHSMSLRTLSEVGYWKKDVVNEDACIFYQCYFHFNGEYTLKPIFVPVSMDTCLADTYKETFVNQYKQRRRWAYNVEMLPWLTKNLWHAKGIPWWRKVYKYFIYMEGNYHWATACIILASMGFLPVLLSSDFNNTVFGYNLPILIQVLMNVALFFLLFYIYVSIVILPKRPKGYKWTRTLGMYMQWMLIPIVAIIWVSLPAVDAQTRLALGKYMEFWVTPKARSIKSTSSPKGSIVSTVVSN